MKPITAVEAESERRRARSGARTLDEILEAFVRARDEHIVGTPSTEEELVRLEQAVGGLLPQSFRFFLARLGGGLFFYGHEIFGPRRVMIHDIELVPDLLSARRTLVAQGTPIPDGTIPFHRARGAVHLMQLGSDDGKGQIVSVPPSTPYPDLASFLETVVLPRRAAPPSRIS